MAKTKALTWQSILNDDKICSLAKAHNIPIEELAQRTDDDKVLPRRSIYDFFEKALCHRDIAYLTHSLYKNRYDKMPASQRISFYQCVYEQIGLANEFLFKGLVTVEYKAFPKQHSIRELYDTLEDKEIKTLISENVIRFQWDSIDAYIDFIDYILHSDRRYLSYNFSPTFEDFIADGWSQSFPIIEGQTVGTESLLELFDKIYKHADKKASQIYDAWTLIIKELQIIYPKRFERLKREWLKKS